MIDDSTHIRVGWLIDGSDGPAMKRMVLTLADGIFTGIEPDHGQLDRTAGTSVDLSHCVVLPPLIDSHVHLCMSAATDKRVRQHQLDAECAELHPVIECHIRNHFSHGVLAVRDGGDRQGCVLAYCNEKKGRVAPIEIRHSGRAYFRKGRYGALIGRPVGGDERLAEAWQQDRQPTDQVKVVNSGLNSLDQFGRQTAPQFSADELKELVAVAHEIGQAVMVHANGELPVRQAVEAGCDSIEHGFFMGRDNLERMAERQTFWVPTIFTMKAYAEFGDRSIVGPDAAVVRKTLEHQLEQLAFARKCGVRIALGTDAGSLGVLHGEAMVEEMKLMLQAGYTLPEVICSATGRNAEMLGMASQWGAIAVGKPANFLVARGLPSQLPRKLSYLEAIYLGGRADPLYHKLRTEPKSLFRK